MDYKEWREALRERDKCKKLKAKINPRMRVKHVKIRLINKTQN